MENVRIMKLANDFYMEHQDSAPFMAAYFTSASTSGDARDRALAFMSLFTDDMHAWYDYNAAVVASGGESLLQGLEKVPSSCRCLPRHNKTCPKSS